MEKSDWTSCPNPCVGLTTLCMRGFYHCVSHGRRQCQGPLAPHPRVTTTLCRIHRTRALCASPFPSIRSALDPRPRSHTGPPPFFSFGDMAARTPSPLSKSPPLSLILPPLARVGSAPWPTLSPWCELSVSCTHAASPSGALGPCSSSPFPSPRIRHRATRSSRRCGTRFVS